MFDNRDEYDHAMQLYQEYQREKAQYLEEMEQKEEESMNFQRLQQQKNLEEKHKQMAKLFDWDD